MYTPPVTSRESVTPKVVMVTNLLEPGAYGGTDDWDEVVTRYPYRKVGMDYLLSMEKVKTFVKKKITMCKTTLSKN